jgi:primosomal protein N' (replication factor Y) (superfamily II helicase)
MYINVKLLNGFSKILTYKVPSTWDIAPVKGAMVTVPLQQRTEIAFVTEVIEQLQEPVSFKIRTALNLEKTPCDPFYTEFITALSDYYLLEPLQFYKRLKSFLQQKELDSPIEQSFDHIVQKSMSELTEEQQKAVDQILEALNQKKYQPFLLQGVTGSGKTELYKQAMVKAHKEHTTTFFLVPEVSLAVQFTNLLKKSLPHIPMYGFHSATSVSDKKDLWQALLQGRPIVIIGVHLPLLLPIANIGLIIIDEEHDVGFQEKKHPKINTKEAALLRAKISNIPIILGSATPSISSLHNVILGKWKRLLLSKRYSGTFPSVKFVKLTSDKKRSQFWISKELEQALRERLVKKEQSIIFLNRRGYSFFVQCAACGFVCECPSCSVSLTLHEDRSLRCHYCSYAIVQPERCPSCKPEKPTMLKKGIGTQQVVSIVQSLFPEARIARADLDSTVNKKKWQKIVDDFHAGNIDVLIGTQTITKGYHFPGVTLVGILWADINLHIPFYNAAETTLQQLIQVAGRAGRQSQESLVIVQSMIGHSVFQFLREQDYSKFYEYEMMHRQQLHYPPCGRFVELELRHADEEVLERESMQCVQLLTMFLKEISDYESCTILGPAKPPVHKIKNIFSRKIYLKASSYGIVHQVCKQLFAHNFQIKIFFTPNPLQ